MVASRKILISQYRKIIPCHSLFLPSKWKANMTPQVEQLFCIFEEWGLTLGVAEPQESVWPWSWRHYGATAPASACLANRLVVWWNTNPSLVKPHSRHPHTCTQKQSQAECPRQKPWFFFKILSSCTQQPSGYTSIVFLQTNKQN